MIPEESQLPLPQRIHLSLGAVCLQSMVSAMKEDQAMPQETGFFFPGFPHVFSQPESKQSFQNISHILRMKCFCLLPRCHHKHDSLNPSLRPNNRTIKQLLLPLTGEKHVGCDSSPDSFFQHFCMWANTQKEQLLFV